MLLKKMKVNKNLEEELKVLCLTMSNQRHTEVRFPLGVDIFKDIAERYKFNLESDFESKYLESLYQTTCNRVENSIPYFLTRQSGI